MSFQLYWQNSCHNPAHGTQHLCFYHLLASHPVPYPFFLYFVRPLFYLFRTFLRRGERSRLTVRIASYRLRYCRNCSGFSCLPHRHTRHVVRLHTSPLNLCFACQPTKRTDDSNMIIIPCHAMPARNTEIPSTKLICLWPVAPSAKKGCQSHGIQWSCSR